MYNVLLQAIIEKNNSFFIFSDFFINYSILSSDLFTTYFTTIYMQFQNCNFRNTLN